MTHEKDAKYRIVAKIVKNWVNASIDYRNPIRWFIQEKKGIGEWVTVQYSIDGCYYNEGFLTFRDAEIHLKKYCDLLNKVKDVSDVYYNKHGILLLPSGDYQ